MCIGLPMLVVRPDPEAPDHALCSRGSEVHSIDMSLVGARPAGSHVLTFLGSAREVISAIRAAQIDDALAAVSAAMSGEALGNAFADLTDREPQLPPHLEAARRAGRLLA
jgi:hydrogenase expression/formation protein HypC